MLLKEGANKNKVANDGSTPLHVACTFTHAAAVTELLMAKADLNIQYVFDVLFFMFL